MTYDVLRSRGQSFVWFQYGGEHRTARIAFVYLSAWGHFLVGFVPP
ncbi:hypothetical protein O983_20045 [Mycobacterium avium 09-5983]|nr:hypothetical protein O984_19355 [Mycobacterium avium 05-4293]ETB21327.1 hypothetical protein O983_20045 [Mycobacterium avium 09-5983]ETB41805.1 hypothetical protein O974_21465 [Mycobacterium avium 11-0986]